VSSSLRIRRVFGAATFSALLSFVLIAGTTVSAQSGTIRACVGSGGKLSVIGPSESCKAGESLLIWNAVGPTGPAGPIGPTGPAGPTGPDGPAGRDGRDAQSPLPPAAIVELQMKVDGMNGNNPTPIQQFSLGATNTGGSASGGGGGAGKASFQDLVVTKMLDGLSLPLLSAAATGMHLKNVEIDVFDVGSSIPFATYVFEDVIVTADLIGSSQTALNEQVSFNYAKITSDITVNGTTFHSCYDLSLAKSC